MCAAKPLNANNKTKLDQQRKEAKERKDRDDKNARGTQKAVYKCTAAGCRKICTTTYGLKRHINARHGNGGASEQVNPASAEVGQGDGQETKEEEEENKTTANEQGSESRNNSTFGSSSAVGTTAPSVLHRQ